uniref:Secreted protein n=1 Tax=Trichogramma kaykai TaxID=54128 RepID=A0ABD2X4W7_9HYME
MVNSEVSFTGVFLTCSFSWATYAQVLPADICEIYIHLKLLEKFVHKTFHRPFKKLSEFLRASDGNQWQILHASKLAWIKQKKALRKWNAPRKCAHERSSSDVPNRYNARVRQRVVCALPYRSLGWNSLYSVAVWDATRRETASSTFSYLFDLRIIECKCCYKFSYLKSWQAAAAKKDANIKKKDKKQTRTNTHKRVCITRVLVRYWFKGARG